MFPSLSKKSFIHQIGVTVYYVENPKSYNVGILFSRNLQSGGKEKEVNHLSQYRT